MNTNLNNTLTIEVPTATPGRFSIGDQAQLRGKKIVALLLAGVGSNKAPSMAPAAQPNDIYLTLVSATGKIVHDNLPGRALQDALVGGQLLGLGNTEIDWSKSVITYTGAAVASQVTALSVIFE